MEEEILLKSSCKKKIRLFDSDEFIETEVIEKPLRNVRAGPSIEVHPIDKSCLKKMTFTITIGDQAENHVGMQKIGKLSESGFNLSDLKLAKEFFESRGYMTDLKDISFNDENKAFILVVRKGLDCILGGIGKNSDDFFQEQFFLEKDTKAYMYGRIVNKHARHNLCFSEEDQDPKYEEGKGRIIGFKNVPLLQYTIEQIPRIIGKKGEGLVAEGNYYYDIAKCGIGFHGDSERKKVVGIRIGASLDLHYQWFYQSLPVGERFIFGLNHGDVYFMDEKAVGTDWKRKTIYTLRHATGCDKFTTIK